MKYQQPTFTLPAGSKKVTQEEWDRIFGKVICYWQCPECKQRWDKQPEGTHCWKCSTVINYIEIR